MSPKYTNALIHETSPYLLQHAHNPVNWKPWDENLLKQAEAENKLLIVSIGYSACHWCHVMEHESFEDESVAETMNAHYIPIKIDREERPDIDAIYMSAIQLMTGQGGWPLNVIILPDGRPVWGGTYFPKEHWMDALQQIAQIHRENPKKLTEYATRLEKGLQETSIIVPPKKNLDFDKETLTHYVSKWSQGFDHEFGGMSRAPKFMMPTNYNFLLRYAFQKTDKQLTEYVHKTLSQMALGGIYDQVGGGFSRYSVDKKWHVPHFEKMGYDNAQLLGLYSKAYRLRKNELYKETVYGTVDFLKREMLDKTGAFYAALDADSLNQEGKLEEGAFYVWTKEEINTIITTDLHLFKAYYNLNDYGHWEHGNYVLIRSVEDSAFAKAHNLELSELKTKKASWNLKLLRFREERHAPRLDDKLLTSWNGLAITGLVEAYKTFAETEFLDLALHTADFILKKQLKKDGSLYRNHKNGKSSINAYLEDYATVIEGFINLYEVTMDLKWLDHSKKLTDYVLKHFTNEENQLFYFTSDQDAKLILRTIEYQDNVIPSSNSIMATNLFRLGHLFTDQNLIKRARQCTESVYPELERYPAAYANWLNLMLNFAYPFHELVVTGKNARVSLKELHRYYIPNAVIAAINKEDEKLSLFKERWHADKDLFYLCTGQTCGQPVEQIRAIIAQLREF